MGRLRRIEPATTGITILGSGFVNLQQNAGVKSTYQPSRNAGYEAVLG